ncbi:hypothetical protein NO392_15600 [Escherichia coli]|uniref:hypothetical protein n=1 Tax=Escherichia coli TaxID=562 RepID=UPI0021C56D50|nr:hypothetical protein [Escherichia coli]MCQ6673545.1 hypothetical protein [Escherichia coli]HBB4818966.1 hypothetical protein [Escherichia coli]
MRVAFIGLLPVPMRFFDLPLITKSHVFTDDMGYPAPKRHTGIAAARREAKKRRRAK